MRFLGGSCWWEVYYLYHVFDFRCSYSFQKRLLLPSGNIKDLLWAGWSEVLCCILLPAYAVFELAVNIPFVSPVIVILYYLALFFLSLVSMKLIFEITWGDILFAGVCGYAAQHFSYACITLVTQLVPLSLNGIWEFLFIRLFPYICVSFIMYFGFVRRNAGKIEIKKRDIRMVWLAFGVLFTAIIISVLVDPDFYRDNAVLMQNIFCKIYAGICSIFAIFIAFYMSRQNRIQHENEIMESMLHNIAEQQKTFPGNH